MKNILFIEPTIRQIGVDYLRSRFNVFYTSNPEEDSLIKVINNNNIHAIITRNEIISGKLIKNCPTIRVIGQHGIGVNNIDVDTATSYKVSVVNVPVATVVSVAEHTIMSVLALSRNLIRMHKEVVKGNWKYRDDFLPFEVLGKKLLIVGFGNIGRRVAEMARVFNMEILIYDPFLKEFPKEMQRVESLKYGLRLADFTTLHVPLMDSTRKMISENEFNVMKSSSYLINVGRGGVVDQKELVKAIKQNKIAGAQLDVLENEPPSSKDPILDLKNIIFTPHIAGDTIEAKDRCSSTLVREVASVLNEQGSKNIVNN